MTYRVGQYRDNAYVTNQRAVVAIYRLEVGNVVTGLVDIVLEYGDTVSGVPGVRRCVVADGHGVVEHIRRMDTQTQAVDTVASEWYRLEDIAVLALCTQRIVSDRVCALYVVPYIRCIDIGYIYLMVLEVLRIEVEAQRDDTVASVNGRQRIVVQAAQGQVTRQTGLGQTKAQRVAFADRRRDCIVLNRHHANEAYMRTVIAVVGLQVTDVLAGRVDIFDAFPFVRRLALTDLYRITVEVGLVNTQTQAVDTVAAVRGRVMEYVLAGRA